MRLVLATATLCTVGFLATSVSNTTTEDSANANVPVSLSTRDLGGIDKSESPESKASSETVGSQASNGANTLNGSASEASEPNNDKEMISRKIIQDLQRVPEVPLDGPSRSPVFIPEFSAASPWGNVAPPENMDSDPVRNNYSSSRDYDVSTSTRGGRDRPVSRSLASSPARDYRSGQAPPLDRPIDTGPQVIQGNARDLLREPDRSSSSIPEIVAVQPNSGSTIERPAVRVSDFRRGSPEYQFKVPVRSENSLPQIVPVQPPPDSTSQQPEVRNVEVRRGSATDLLPIAEPAGENTVTIAAVQSPPDLKNIAQSRNDVYTPPPQEVQRLEQELEELEEKAVVEDVIEASPALTIFNPMGFGADNNTGYISATYQSRARFVENDDGAIALGFGFGDAQEAVGVELSYTLASVFGENRDFGTGGFNVKVHRQLPDDWAVAAGWNGFLFLGEDDGFKNSLYGVVTKVIRTQESLSSPLSRIALTAGVGNGQFLSDEALEEDEGGINIFGSAAVRVVKPVSVIAEWTGQDLALGASIAPFKNVPFVITPAVRDITGAGDGARFVLGAGFAFRF